MNGRKLSMETWQNYISEGNKLFQVEKYRQAEAKYWAALKNVQANFSQWHDPEMAITSLIITFKNLADSHAKQKQIKKAGSTLVQAYKIFKNIQEKTHSNSPWQKACEEGIEDIKAKIMNFLQTNPEANICQCCYQSIFSGDEMAHPHLISKTIH